LHRVAARPVHALAPTFQSGRRLIR